jgi:hypothetical protein
MNALDVLTFEEWRLPNMGPTRETDIPCSSCGHYLIKQEFSLGLRFTCDNHECPLFRESQGIRLVKNTQKNIVCRDCGKELTDLNWYPCLRIRNMRICKICSGAKRILQPGYQSSLVRKRENYEYACTLGFPAKIASRINYKSKEEIRKIAQVQGLLN